MSASSTPDFGEPAANRQAELEAVYARQQATESPYQGVEIRTAGECYWILQRRQWSGDICPPAWSEPANLSGAILAGATLGSIKLHGANLRGASCRGVQMGGAWLMGADLSSADLSGAHLHGIELGGANLSYANFCNADLSGARLMRANLCGADLHGATLQGAQLDAANITATRLEDCDLTNAKLTLYQGNPHWPHLRAHEASMLYAEVTDPATDPERLDALAWQWPGILLQAEIAKNPNTHPWALRSLGQRVPAAFLRNPVLPWLFLENPLWLTADEAQAILLTITEQSLELTGADLAIVRAIERCACMTA